MALPPRGIASHLGPGVPPLAAVWQQACYRCFREETPDTPFARCSSCKRIVYCGTACQKDHWPKHKQLCKAWRALSTDASCVEDSVTTGAIDFGRLNETTDSDVLAATMQLRRALRGEPTADDKDLLGWEPRCLACGRTDRHIRAELGPVPPPNAERHLLKPCTTCRSVFYCSSEHWAHVRAAHAAPCSETESNGYGSTSSACALNIAMRADARVIARSTDPAGCVRYMPARVASSWESLVGRSMVTEYDALFAVEGRAYSGAQPPPEGRKSTLYADDAWTRRDELVIHILGAGEAELTYLSDFEEILHRLPNVKHLRVAMVGPGMANMVADVGESAHELACHQCKARGRRRSHEHVAALYHDYMARPPYKKPVLAVAFNSGCAQAEHLPWQTTVGRLVQTRTPSVFTSYDRKEALEDVEVLRAAGARLEPALGPCFNPWGSALVKPAPHRVLGFYTANGWLAGGFR